MPRTRPATSRNAATSSPASEQRFAMSIITIELTDPVQDEPCPCCGNVTTRLTRFVQSNGAAFAVYYAAFTQGHSERGIAIALSLGDWAKDEPDDRVAFALRIRSTDS